MNLLTRHPAFMQVLKWTVYTLLIFNFGYYIFDDWRAAQSTITESSTFLDITGAYATSLDELAWFFLIGFLEYETYWLEDPKKHPWLVRIMKISRPLCYIVLGHTLYAFATYVSDLNQADVLTDVTDVCALVGQDLSFLRNLVYETIEASNCASLSSGGDLYLFHNEPVVTDASGYAENLGHAWTDVIEISGWISLSLMILFIVSLQNRDIYESSWIKGTNRLQLFVYCAIAGTAFYWAFYGHYVYTWDILLWIGGFGAIESNLSEWRDEIESEQET